MSSLSCSMWGLVPHPGIKPGPPALGAWSPSHWTTREVPVFTFMAETQTLDGKVIRSWLRTYKCPRQVWNPELLTCSGFFTSHTKWPLKWRTTLLSLALRGDTEMCEVLCSPCIQLPLYSSWAFPRPHSNSSVQVTRPICFFPLQRTEVFSILSGT